MPHGVCYIQVASFGNISEAGRQFGLGPRIVLGLGTPPPLVNALSSLRPFCFMHTISPNNSPDNLGILLY